MLVIICIFVPVRIFTTDKYYTSVFNKTSTIYLCIICILENLFLFTFMIKQYLYPVITLRTKEFIKDSSLSDLFCLSFIKFREF